MFGFEWLLDTIAQTIAPDDAMAVDDDGDAGDAGAGPNVRPPSAHAVVSENDEEDSSRLSASNPVRNPESLHASGTIIAPDENTASASADNDPGIPAPGPNFQPQSTDPLVSAEFQGDTPQEPASILDPSYMSTPRTETMGGLAQEQMFCPDSPGPRKTAAASPARDRRTVLSPVNVYSPIRNSAVALREVERTGVESPDSALKARVLFGQTMKAVATGLSSRIRSRNLFELCALRSELSEDLIQLIRKDIIEVGPELLMERSVRHTSCPDGYTMFMAAAYSNQVDVLQTIFALAEGEARKALFLDTDSDGLSALHVAAQMGQLRSLKYLLWIYTRTFGTAAQLPVDVLGRTPLGVAFASPEGAAEQNRNAIRALFPMTDPAILGRPLPPKHRVYLGDLNGLRAAAGTSEIPGKRVIMEDRTLCWSAPSALVLSVCDGHADDGRVAQFVAKGLVDSLGSNVASHVQGDETLLREKVEQACQRIDEGVQSKKLRGGSTGILAFVTKTKIVVANVGDSRCILVSFDGEQSAKEFLNGSEASAWGDTFSVVPLSTDHKPDDPGEKNRIEQSGLEVYEERFSGENGPSILYKIKLSNGDELSGGEMLACSRSFGDFEFKANKHVGPEAQAVTAVPDVLVRELVPTTDAFMVLACDGIWDVMKSHEVAMFVTEKLQHYLFHSELDRSTDLLPRIGDDLLRYCLLKKAAIDNLSVVVVALPAVMDAFTGPNKTLSMAPAATASSNIVGSDSIWNRLVMASSTTTVQRAPSRSQHTRDGQYNVAAPLPELALPSVIATARNMDSTAPLAAQPPRPARHGGGPNAFTELLRQVQDGSLTDVVAGVDVCPVGYGVTLGVTLENSLENNIRVLSLSLDAGSLLSPGHDPCALIPLSNFLKSCPSLRALKLSSRDRFPNDCDLMHTLLKSTAVNTSLYSLNLDLDFVPHLAALSELQDNVSTSMRRLSVRIGKFPAVIAMKHGKCAVPTTKVRAAMVLALCRNPYLRRLDVVLEDLDTSFVFRLISSVSTLLNLTLSIGYDPVSTNGRSSTTRVLFNAGLHRLVLSGFQLHGDDVIDLFETNASLKKLVLDNCNVSEDAMAILKRYALSTEGRPLHELGFRYRSYISQTNGMALDYASLADLMTDWKGTCCKADFAVPRVSLDLDDLNRLFAAFDDCTEIWLSNLELVGVNTTEWDAIQEFLLRKKVDLRKLTFRDWEHPIDEVSLRMRLNQSVTDIQFW